MSEHEVQLVSEHEVRVGVGRGERLRDRLRGDLARERFQDPLPFWVLTAVLLAAALAVFVLVAVWLWPLVAAAFSG